MTELEKLQLRIDLAKRKIKDEISAAEAFKRVATPAAGKLLDRVVEILNTTLDILEGNDR